MTAKKILKLKIHTAHGTEFCKWQIIIIGNGKKGLLFAVSQFYLYLIEKYSDSACHWLIPLPFIKFTWPVKKKFHLIITQQAKWLALYICILWNNLSMTKKSSILIFSQ